LIDLPNILDDMPNELPYVTFVIDENGKFYRRATKDDLKNLNYKTI